jgi:hypothetical protein
MYGEGHARDRALVAQNENVRAALRRNGSRHRSQSGGPYTSRHHFHSPYIPKLDRRTRASWFDHIQIYMRLQNANLATLLWGL